jgi:predicted DNA-binding transcriptional regulator AlpA
MAQVRQTSALRLMEAPTTDSEDFSELRPPDRIPPVNSVGRGLLSDPLLTADDVARRLNVSKDWVWDHSSRKFPHLPVIRMGDGTLRYRASRIEEFISEQERLSAFRTGRR